MSIFSFSHVNKTKYSTFNMSHDVKLSMEMGQLIPIVCEEVLPGDTFKLSSEYLIRLAPMIAPIMHRVDVRTETFFVPNRILCKDWEKVMYPSQSPNQSADAPGSVSPSLPVFDPHAIFSQPEGQSIMSWEQNIEGDQQLRRSVVWNEQCSLADYLGIPTENISATTAPQTYISALPFLAYQKIYNDYYRDQNLMPDLSDFADANGRGFVGNTNNLFDLSGDLSSAWAAGSTQGRGLNTFDNLFALRYRCWEKDYFTSALPWRQAGDPVVAPLMYQNGRTVIRNANTGLPVTDNHVLAAGNQGQARTVAQSINASNNIVDATNYYVNVDVSANTGLSIHDLQTASWLQRFLENVALGGSRAIEQIKAHFGVQVPDYRLQRAEYLGGTRTPMTVGEVLQTSETVEDQPLGQPGGHASAIGSSHGITKKFVEHGWVITLLSVVPRTSYQQGLPRKFTRFNRLDFAWPEFATLGEQEVFNRELYLGAFNDNVWDNNGVFGYQQRYAEYKYIPSTVHGDFRSNLDFWHLGRIFDDNETDSNHPKLNRNFVECRPTFREFSVESGYNHLWVMIHNKIKANRPLPQISNSSLA